MAKKKQLSRVEQLQIELAQALKIEKANAKFNKLSVTGKRIAIAQDVIDSLKAKKFNASQGVYFKVNGTKEFNLYEDNTLNKELQDVICDDDSTCTVCGIGAIFASKVKITDGLKIGDLNTRDQDNSNGFRIGDDYGMIDYLSTIFSSRQLREIEFAFEGEYMGYGDGHDDLQDLCDSGDSKYRDFYEKYNNDSDRMIAIMKNIIKNKGKFKP